MNCQTDLVIALKLKAIRIRTIINVFVAEATKKHEAPRTSVALSLRSILGNSVMMPGVCTNIPVSGFKRRRGSIN